MLDSVAISILVLFTQLNSVTAVCQGGSGPTGTFTERNKDCSGTAGFAEGFDNDAGAILFRAPGGSGTFENDGGSVVFSQKDEVTVWVIGCVGFFPFFP
jgi:hypothetical protein